MKIYKKIIVFFTIIISLCFFSPVISASNVIDTNKNSNLIINYKDKNVILSNAEFSLYLFAECDGKYNFSVTENFKKYNVKFPEKEQDYQVASSTLEGYVLRDALTPYTKGITDSSGICNIENLKSGMYLIIGKDVTVNNVKYRSKPFMVTLPFFDYENNEWSYELEVSPKFESVPLDSPENFLSRKVIKVWDDKGYESLRPNDVTVDLLCDGNIYDTVILNKNNNWRYEWEKLDMNKSWSIVERNANDSYSVSVTLEESTFVITNSIIPTSTPPSDSPPDSQNPPSHKLPQTGQPWSLALTLAFLGLCFVVLGLYLKRSVKNEN